MRDDNWDLINGPPAHHIEGLNEVNTINVIEGLVTFLNTHRVKSNPQPLAPNEAALKELHRSGTLFLLEEPGAYRRSPVVVSDALGNVIHDPPPWQDVERHMADFFVELMQIWNSGDALDAAAFALWRINWVHPFKNGNGRTARAYSYACLCAKLEVWLPGQPTVIDQITMTRQDYEAALRIGDAGCALDKAGRDLSTMKHYLDGLLQTQISSV